MEEEVGEGLQALCKWEGRPIGYEGSEAARGNLREKLQTRHSGICWTICACFKSLILAELQPPK